ncbi:peptidoglycan-binding domain-containing protein [Edaphobacter bradus]|uniref:peptidoglycan-binding domain-containing protein n=1 Tax=Edaphobacter bradus TaxID=2259016 RepID=UPI0037C1689A
MHSLILHAGTLYPEPKRYDSRLNGEFQKFSVGPLPDLLARDARLCLIYLGFHPGPVDWVAGRQTLSALAEFQSLNNLPVTTSIDAGTVAQLRNTLPPI